MQGFRKTLKRTSILWLACLLPALLFMFSTQLHVHRLLDHSHPDHQHDEVIIQHDHSSAGSGIHLGNIHDEQFGLSPMHAEQGVLAIDIPANGLGKAFALMLLAFAFIAFSILLLSPRASFLLLPRPQQVCIAIRWRCALSPLRRAPPL